MNFLDDKTMVIDHGVYTIVHGHARVQIGGRMKDISPLRDDIFESEKDSLESRGHSAPGYNWVRIVRTSAIAILSTLFFITNYPGLQAL